jgi:hypothetical protein
LLHRHPFLFVFAGKTSEKGQGIRQMSKLPPTKLFEDNIDELITKAVSEPIYESNDTFHTKKNAIYNF